MFTLSRHLKRGGKKKNPYASPLVGFQSSLASAEGGTFIVGLPLPTRLPPGPEEWQGDHEHLPTGQAGLSVLFSINQSYVMVGRKMDTGPVCPETLLRVGEE